MPEPTAYPEVTDWLGSEVQHWKGKAREAEQRAERAEAERDAMAALMERMPDTHARFSVLGSDEPPKCADWCYACRLEQAEAERDAHRALLAAASKHLRTIHGLGRHDDLGPNLSCAGCDLARRIDAALDALETPGDAPQAERTDR